MEKLYILYGNVCMNEGERLINTLRELINAESKKTIPVNK